MFLTELLKFHKKCSHHNVMPNVEQAYCPDCGKLIKNDWYITRCACCGRKLKTISKNGKIIPQSHYCTNCGSDSYLVEKLEALSFIDINFAVLVKNVIEEEHRTPTMTMCWSERKCELPKLLIQSL